ncbi:cytochrome c peroxidase [Nemorincola caseinilytica]|uniref:Cytochrome c peroxidase n=1 Tax=Nemorincola caseinilytica TaxID=2054315 RepID=A0ABP8NNH5_9BACT
MRKAVVTGLLVLLVALAGFRKKEKVQPGIPQRWPAPAYDLGDAPLSEKKIQLGRLLFYDPILSRDSTISCASCHSPYNAFTHVDHSLSHGIDGRIGTRNSPVLVNLAWSTTLMWDGSITHLDEQAATPISNPLEMDESMPHIVQKLQANDAYRRLFRDAFGRRGITDKNVLRALSQFMLTLVSANARYDSVKRGEAEFTESEARGYALFTRHCSACHTEPLFTSNGFENNGLAVDDSLHDIGRMKITHLGSDSLKFKVPTLRNIAQSPPYMHDGRFKTLGQVLNNYIMGIQQSPTLNPRLQKGIYLTAVQKADLVAFLYTLSDHAFLSDPRHGIPGK